MRAKATAIVQARMGSERLPGKVLLDMGGETVLGRVVQRLRGARLLEQIVVATTVLPGDDAIEQECVRIGVACFRGSSEDVLDRYYRAAQTMASEFIVRITADCPVIDPALVDESIGRFRAESVDYCATDVPATIPRGNDVEVFTMAVLQQCWREGHEPYQREHVTPYIYEHPAIFRLAAITSELDCRQYRWTLDTQEDYEVLCEIYKEFHNQNAFGWPEIVELMSRRPELLQWNAKVMQKSLK